MDRAKVETYRFKVVVVGDSGVGKSSLLNQFIENKFSPKYSPTIGVDFKVAFMSSTARNGKSIQLSLWDHSGCAKFRSIISSYWRGADGVILVYDVTNRDSFINLARWIDDLESQGIMKKAPVTIIGNKIDHDKNDRRVSKEEARSFAFERGFQYVEASALTGDSVAEAFETVATFILRKTVENEEKENQTQGQVDNGNNTKSHRTNTWASRLDSKQQTHKNASINTNATEISLLRDVDVDNYLAERENGGSWLGGILRTWRCW